MANYYNLITGLPDILMDDSKSPYTLTEFKELCEESLSKSDKVFLYYFFLKFDCLNVVALLKDKNARIRQCGNLSEDQCRQLIEEADEMNRQVPFGAPRFLMDFILHYADHQDDELFFAEDAVLLEYYRFAMNCKDKYVREWFELNFNIINILTAYIARNYGWDIENYVLDDNEVSDTILKNAQTRDFNLQPVIDYVEDIIKIAEIEDPVLKEKNIDAFKWLWLDDKTFFQQFSMFAVFAYLCKLEMNERWEKLDVETGKATFTQIVDNLRSEAKVPEEFLK